MRFLAPTNTLDYLDHNDALATNALHRFGSKVILGKINAIAAGYVTRGVRANTEPYHHGSAVLDYRGADCLSECQLISLMDYRVDRDVWQISWLASQCTAFLDGIEGLETQAMQRDVPKEIGFCDCHTGALQSTSSSNAPCDTGRGAAALMRCRRDGGAHNLNRMGRKIESDSWIAFA